MFLFLKWILFFRIVPWPPWLNAIARLASPLLWVSALDASDAKVQRNNGYAKQNRDFSDSKDNFVLLRSKYRRRERTETWSNCASTKIILGFIYSRNSLYIIIKYNIKFAWFKQMYYLCTCKGVVWRNGVQNVETRTVLALASGKAERPNHYLDFGKPP